MATILEEKLAQATEILEEFDIDVWLTFARETVMNPDPALDLILELNLTWHSALLVSRSGRHTAIVGHFDSQNVRDLGVYNVVGYHHGIGEHLLATLEKLRPQKIAINYSSNDVAADGLTLGNYHKLLSILEGSPYPERLVSAEGIIAALRGRKTPTEIDRVRHAVATTEALFDSVHAHVRPGMTQKQIAAFLHEKIDGQGLGYAWERQYDPIVTCGPDSAIGHAAPGDIALEKGHTLHIDLGVKQDGYCSDLQRMWYVLDDGESEAPADVRRAFEAVRGAIEAGREALTPGTPGWKVDAAARQHLVSAGYPEYMHALGHLLGRSAHDGAAILGPRWDRYQGVCELPVEVGNIFTLELHVVVPDRGIVSLEEDVLVTEDGVDYLSSPQIELRLIDSSA